MWPQKMVNIKTYKKESLQDQRVITVINDITNTLGTDGKVLVRASGTEPLIRVTLSCELESDLDTYMEQIVSKIKEVMED